MCCNPNRDIFNNFILCHAKKGIYNTSEIKINIKTDDRIKNHLKSKALNTKIK